MQENMNNLGYQIGSAFGFDKGICIEMGNDVSRLMAILNLIGLIGALVILAYSPLKQLIGGSPKGLFSERFSEMKDDIPKFAMHAPYEISGKADVYEAVRGYKAFLLNA